MKQLIQKVKLISILLLVISFVGCENDDVELPKVISGFTHTINAETGTVTFINTSVNSRNYFWSFGDGTSSTEINPIKTYPAGEYLVTLKATNVAGASDTSEDTIVISDVGAPIITLLGDTKVNIKVGGTFTDPGATATDDVDGDVTANIVVGGDAVDVNTAGTYIITYNVSDAAGNAATQRTRTVIVAADAVKPVITLNGSATINIKVGDTFTDPGATATDNLDGDISANIVVAGNAVDVNTAATYIITYNVSDAAGNAAAQVTRTVIVAAVPGPSPSNLILDFENNLTGIGVDAFESAGELLANPVSGGINTSPNVYAITYASVNQWWGGVGFVVGSAALSDAYTEYTVKLYSTVAPINVLFEVEQNGVAGTTIGNTQEITKANEWVEVTFTLQGGAGINRVLVRPAVGNKTGTKTHNGILYVDDIAGAEGTGGTGGGTGGCTGTLIRAVDFPVDFEGCETFMATNGDVKFGDAISAELADNPSPTGINTSAYVLKVDKPAGASHWEGIQNAFAADFNSSLTFKVKIYSTLPNIEFQFEISNDPNEPGVGNPTPIKKTVTNANVWTEVEVTFTGVPPGGHNNFVIKPNDIGGGTVPISGIYYFDDVRLE